eukprot:gene6199-6671_t
MGNASSNNNSNSRTEASSINSISSNPKESEIYFWEELRELRGPDADGDFVRPASFMITPIWYRFDYEKLSWSWSPEAKKDLWMSVDTLIVSSGFWKGETPAPPNVKIINALRELKPKPMITYVRQTKDYLGRGAFGEVYKYDLNESSQIIAKKFQIVNYQHCAVKKIQINPQDQQLNRKIVKELSILYEITQIPNEHIIFFWGIRYTKNYVELIMEYCSGDLKSIIRRLKIALPHSLVHCLALHLLRGLDFLHFHDIIHRDIKPDNILFVQENEKICFKLCDFGLSRHAEALPFTTIGFTPGYIPPECLFQNHYSKKMDIWALGVVLYESVSPNIKPYDRCLQNFLTNNGVLAYEPLPPGSHISTAIRNLISQCLTISYEERPDIIQLKGLYELEFEMN